MEEREEEREERKREEYYLGTTSLMQCRSEPTRAQSLYWPGVTVSAIWITWGGR